MAVLKQRYNVDISGHRTRSLADVDLMDFDRIFILDAYVAEAVKARHPQLIDRITVWDIDDPFGRDLTAYENTARLLDYCLDKLRAGGD